jgi:Ser/Thr protein kinase RdoA (MazF antagonist)
MDALRYCEHDQPRIVSSLSGERNDNFLVVDSTGRRLIVRWFRRNPDRARIAFQLDVQEHLSREGIPTAAIVATRDRRRITPGEPPCVAFEYLEGTHYAFTSFTQLKAAARTFAHLHAALDTLRIDDVPTAMNPHVERWWQLPGQEIEALGATVRPHDLALLQRTLAQLDLDACTRLPTGFVHGDFHGRNLIFSQDEVAAVLDFDVVHRTVRAAVVARSVLAFARPQRGSLHVRAKFATTFLAEYQRHRPLTDPERAALPALAFTPRAGECELLAAEGEDRAIWAARRIGAVVTLAGQREKFARTIPASAPGDLISLFARHISEATSTK